MHNIQLALNQHIQNARVSNLPPLIKAQKETGEEEDSDLPLRNVEHIRRDRLLQVAAVHWPQPTQYTE